MSSSVLVEPAGLGTGQRLLLAFALLLLVFAGAATMAIRGLLEVHDLLHGMMRQESGVRAALELASAVRDQYAHQAHTIILGNQTHMHMYADAERLVAVRLSAIQAHLQSPSERRWAEEISSASGELDQIFRQKIVPAVLGADRDMIQREHARAQELVSLIQERTDQIVSSFERSMGTFELHAAQVERSTYRWALFLFGSSIALAAVLGLWVARSIARPVAALAGGAARIAAGDLDTRIEIGSKDELGRLAAEFNRMAAALKDNQARLVESEKLAGIGRLAAGVAHEINNPLAVILGYARVLARKANPELATDLLVVEEEALRCQEIVEGLLELSRPLRFPSEPVALRDLCQEIAERLEETGQAIKGSVTVEGAATTRGSATKLRQVLTNLLKNATEASGPGGRVETRLFETEGDLVVVEVHDNGPGLGDEARGHLFEPFFTTKPKGTGLGLAVSRAIALAHGGDIEAKNADGGGAVFTLRLPKEGRSIA